MSYILDALKKAEADRDPDTRARLAIEERERRRNRTLIYGVIAALIANAVILLWLFLPDAAKPPSNTTRPAAGTDLPAVIDEQAGRASVTAVPPPAPVPEITDPQEGARDVNRRIVQEPASPTRRPEPQETVLEVQSVTLAGLPAAARSRFPALDFSTHIYADAPDLRAIVVNGSRLLEGDVLGELTVHEITETGAVFAFERYLVLVPVLEGWN